MKQFPLKMPDVKSAFFAFNGGLDEITPPIQQANGALRSCSNVEIGANGGYATLSGYERYDGRLKPSDAVYHIIDATITGSYAAGNTLTGASSGATGVLVTTGTSGYLVLTKLTGTFQSGENLQVSAVTIAVATSATSIGSASTQALNATYTNLAATQYRADIAVVPGAGSVLGVWMFAGNKYAFRNNVGETAAVLHKQSSSGWTTVTMYNEISFTAGSGAATIIDAGTLAQGGVTATIKRVVVQSGSLAGGTAVGRLIITNPAGGNFSGGAATVGAGTLTLTAVQTAITFLPNGRFRFDNWNFGGGTGATKMYGCDGVNRGFEFDGTTLVPLSTGMTTDTPTRVKAHKNHLFFAFAGSAQHSGIGDPYRWTTLSGAGELACGDTITDFTQLTGNSAGAAMAMWTRQRTLVLYGNDSTDWNLVAYSDESGALAHTAQFITQGVVLHDLGIKLLSTTQAYGNFLSSVASQKVAPSLNALISTATDSMVVRTKNQYRVFFSGGDAVYMTFNNGGGISQQGSGGAASQPGVGVNGFTTVRLPNAITCSVSAIGSSGAEEIYFGSTDGYVYQMDVGTSFDGAAITWRTAFTFNHFGGPRQLKTFRKGVTEVTGSGYAEFSAGYQLSYGSTEFDVASDTSITSALSETSWDSFTWDQFVWDGRNLAPYEADIVGTAENIALAFSGSSAEFQPFTMNAEIIHYTNRRLLR